MMRMTRREESLVDIIGALFRLHRDGKAAELAEAMRSVEVILLNPSPVQCEGVALDLLKISPKPETAGFFSGLVYMPKRTT